MVTENQLRKILSSNVREHRIRHKWNQVDLAEKTGISVNFINDIESEKKWASPSTMIKLANAFEIEVYELYKPPGSFPDNFDSIINKYTDIIHQFVDDAHLSFVKSEEVRPKR